MRTNEPFELYIKKMTKIINAKISEINAYQNDVSMVHVMDYIYKYHLVNSNLQTQMVNYIIKEETQNA